MCWNYKWSLHSHRTELNQTLRHIEKWVRFAYVGTTFRVPSFNNQGVQILQSLNSSETEFLLIGNKQRHTQNKYTIATPYVILPTMLAILALFLMNILHFLVKCPNCANLAILIFADFHTFVHISISKQPRHVPTLLSRLMSCLRPVPYVHVTPVTSTVSAGPLT